MELLTLRARAIADYAYAVSFHLWLAVQAYICQKAGLYYADAYKFVAMGQF